MSMILTSIFRILRTLKHDSVKMSSPFGRQERFQEMKGDRADCGSKTIGARIGVVEEAQF